MTLTEMLAAVYEEARYQSSPATAVTTRITRYLNEGVRTIFSEPGLVRLADSDAPFTIASVASQARYVAPESIAQIKGIREITNDITLQALSLTAYRHCDPDPASSSGTPTHYVPIGRLAVAVQPSDASAIFVDSDAAGDTGTAFIEGIITGGYHRTASVTMTGTTAVNLSSTISTWIEVTDFYISANAVGTVTLHEDASGGTELARITIGQKRPRYFGFYLWPTPSAAVDYLVDYRRELQDLVNAADEPPLPLDFHRVLVDYAAMREAQYRDQVEQAVQHGARYQKGLQRLKFCTQHDNDEIPALGRGGLVGRSRLGAWFPADYYTRG